MFGLNKLIYRGKRSDCPLCRVDGSHARTKFLNTSHHRAEIFENLEILTCRSCGSSWVEHPPINEQLYQYYASQYKVAAVSAASTPRRPKWDSRSVSLVALGRLFAVMEPGSLFLDIGPGSGGSLTAASYLLDRPRLSCIEQNKLAKEYLASSYPGLLIADAVKDLVAKAGQPPKFVYSSHCFEHFAINELRLALRELFNAMAPEGVLVSEVPNVPVERLPKARNHAPHLIFFSRAGMTALLESVGFEVKLCIGVLGKSPAGDKYVGRVFADQSAPADFLAKVQVFNGGGDWIAAREAWVIKTVAVKPVRARDRRARSRAE